MKNEELEPLPEDTRKWLDAERPLDAVPSDARARLFAKIAATTAMVAPASAAGAPADAAASTGTGAWGSKLTIAVVAFAVGGAVGAIGHTLLTPPLVVPPPVVLNVAVQEAKLEVEAPPATGKAAAKPAAPAARPKPGSPDSLNAERSLIEQARTALSRQDARAALAALNQHEREFPSGQLSEDRIALLVVATSALGDAPTAKRLADTFRARYPSSLLLPAVDAASPP